MNARTIKTCSLFLIITTGLFLTSCMIKTFNVTTIKKTPEAINVIKVVGGILCVSFDVSISEGYNNFTKNLAIELKLFKNESQKTEKVAVGPFNQHSDDNKFFYLYIPPGTYEFSGIEATPVKVAPFERPLVGDYKWNLKVDFAKREAHKINIGDVIYIGSYSLVGKNISTEYKFTNFNIRDKFNVAQNDLKSLMGNDNLKLKKKLNLLNNIKDLEYNFPKYKETVLDWL